MCNGEEEQRLRARVNELEGLLAAATRRAEVAEARAAYWEAADALTYAEGEYGLATEGIGDEDECAEKVKECKAVVEERKARLRALGAEVGS
jgi:hypothetical protein